MASIYGNIKQPSLREGSVKGNKFADHIDSLDADEWRLPGSTLIPQRDGATIESYILAISQGQHDYDGKGAERVQKLMKRNPYSASMFAQAAAQYDAMKRQSAEAQTVRDQYIRPESTFTDENVGSGIGPYEIGAKVPGVSDPKGLRDALVNRGLFGEADKIKTTYNLGESPFAKVSPKDYERQSIQKFEQSGKHSDLIPTKNIDPEKRAELGQKLRKEYNQLAGTFIDVRDSFARIDESSKAQTAAGDLALIFNFMKMLDPQSVVRESEFRSAEQARAWMSKAESAGVYIPSFVKTAIQKADPENSGAFLLPEQRKDFTSRAESLYARQLSSHKQLEEQYTGIAKRAGVDPVDVVTDFRYRKTKTDPKTGIRYYQKDGDWYPEK